MKESFKVEGIERNKFHTTRVAIVKKFKAGQQIREDINSGKETLYVKCVPAKSAAGKTFINLVDA